MATISNDGVDEGAMRILGTALVAAMLVAGCGRDDEGVVLAPTEVTVTAQDGSITVSWSPQESDLSYNLYWSTTEYTAPDGERIADVRSPYTLSGLTNWTRYYVIVTAVDGDTESGQSDERMGRPSPPISSLSFSDQSLADCILEGFADESAHYVGEIDTVDCTLEGISGLEGIGDLRALRELWIGFNSVADVSPLAGLTELTLLAMNDNVVVDVSPLGSLTGLEVLNASGNDISDLSGLSGMSGLFQLSLGGNDISDLTGLPANIGIIGLGDNAIVDVSPLAGLSNLTDITLDRNAVEDVGDLANLVGATALRVNDNEVSAGVAELVALTEANLISLTGNVGIPCDDLVVLQNAFPDEGRFGRIVRPETAIPGTDCTP